MTTSFSFNFFDKTLYFSVFFPKKRLLLFLHRQKFFLDSLRKRGDSLSWSLLFKKATVMVTVMESKNTIRIRNFSTVRFENYG